MAYPKIKLVSFECFGNRSADFVLSSNRVQHNTTLTFKRIRVQRSALSFPPQVTIWVMIIFYSNVNNENTDNAVKHELYMSWKSNGIHFPSFYVNTLIQHGHGTTVEAPPWPVFSNHHRVPSFNSSSSGIWIASAIYMSIPYIAPKFSARHKLQKLEKQPTPSDIWDCFVIVGRNQIISSIFHAVMIVIRGRQPIYRFEAVLPGMAPRRGPGCILSWHSFLLHSPSHPPSLPLPVHSQASPPLHCADLVSCPVCYVYWIPALQSNPGRDALDDPQSARCNVLGSPCTRAVPNHHSSLRI